MQHASPSVVVPPFALLKSILHPLSVYPLAFYFHPLYSTRLVVRRLSVHTMYSQPFGSLFKRWLSVYWIITVEWKTFLRELSRDFVEWGCCARRIFTVAKIFSMRFVAESSILNYKWMHSSSNKTFYPINSADRKLKRWFTNQNDHPGWWWSS